MKKLIFLTAIILTILACEKEKNGPVIVNNDTIIVSVIEPGVYFGDTDQLTIEKSGNDYYLTYLNVVYQLIDIYDDGEQVAFSVCLGAEHIYLGFYTKVYDNCKIRLFDHNGELIDKFYKQ